MSVNLEPLAKFHPITGIQLGTYPVGIKYTGRDDLLIIELSDNTHSAGVFTQNHFAAPAVQIARQCLLAGQPKYLFYLAGNANAGTGEKGMQDMETLCTDLAKISNAPPSRILPFTTGVIGEYLPVEKIRPCLTECFNKLAFNQWNEAAQSIITTDTQAKGISKQFRYNNQLFTINGIAKGSGMIAPNMATMLAFIATDAYVSAEMLSVWIKEINALSFNAISIDGDTSTNDAFIISATGYKRPAETNDLSYLEFVKTKLTEVAVFLAQQIVRDGEGATKFISISVEQARDQQEARQVAKSIANSPLVKTALFAGDPNWGRILMAIGNADLPDFAPAQCDLLINYVPIIEKGSKSASYNETLGKELFSQPEIAILVKLGRGSGQEQIYTCDLSYEYVRINAAYRS